MSTTVHINGSQGEGGGQILRSSLALALVTGRTVSVENIRAGRAKPGLMKQHLTAVQAAATVCGGGVHGAGIGSRSLTFEPRPVRVGRHHFKVGTAGSATLVLQTVLPALLIAHGTSELTLEGGTHNPWAPPFEFLEKAYLPLVNRMGPRVAARLHRHGFYPAGGGRLTVTIQPARQLAGFDLLERGPVLAHSARAIVANLPDHIARREVERILTTMSWDPNCGSSHRVEAFGPGNIAWAEIQGEHVCEVFTAFGRLGTRAEQVADEVTAQVCEYLDADVPVGPHLADQLLLPLAIGAWQSKQAGEIYRSEFRTVPLTGHATTHINILRQFLEIDIHVEPSSDARTCHVVIRSPSLDE